MWVLTETAMTFLLLGTTRHCVSCCLVAAVHPYMHAAAPTAPESTNA